jgi:hypothetical protein
MVKRGRKPQFRPIKPQTEGGNYRLYVPGRGVISLETADEKEAWTKAGQFSQNYASGAKHAPPAVSSDSVTGTANAAPIQTPTSKEMLGAWISQPQDSGHPSITQPTTYPSPSPSVAESSPTLSLTPSSSISDKVNAVLPPEKRAKIASMLAKGITLINVAGTAWCVKLLGTIPKIDDEDEAKDVLKIGWELQLEDLFVNHPPQPWMVIAGGTAALGVGMLLNGERIKKEDKNRPRPPERVGESLTDET